MSPANSNHGLGKASLGFLCELRTGRRYDGLAFLLLLLLVHGQFGVLADVFRELEDGHGNDARHIFTRHAI